MPRPLGPAIHGSKPNKLVQFYYIDLGPTETGDKYVLMNRDGLSHYTWLYSFAGTNEENADNSLIEWCAAFGVPRGLMSDGPSHLKN